MELSYFALDCRELTATTFACASVVALTLGPDERGTIVAKKTLQDLGKRERQIAEAVYRLGEASVASVLAEIADAPTYSTVRAMLGLLVEKGVLRIRREGKRCLYWPATPREAAAKSAFSNLLNTFFSEQPTEALAALLDLSGQLANADLDRMKKLIEQARKEDR